MALRGTWADRVSRDMMEHLDLLVTLVAQDALDLVDSKEETEHQGVKVHRDLMAHPGRLALLEFVLLDVLVVKDPWVRMEDLDSQAPLDLKVSQVTLDSMGQVYSALQVQWGNLGRMEDLGHLGELDQRASKGGMECLAHKAPKGTRGLLGEVALLDVLDHVALLDVLGIKVIEDLMDQRVTEVRQGLKETLELKAL